MRIKQTSSDGLFRNVWGRLGSYQVLSLSFFLLFGGALAWAASFYNPQKGLLRTNVKVIEYRKLKIADRAIIKRESVKGYSRVTVLLRTVAPENSKATAIAYGIRGDGNIYEIQRIEDISSTWVSWEQQISYSDIEIVIKPSIQSSTAFQDRTLPSNPNLIPKSQDMIKENLATAESPKSEQNSPSQTELDLLIYLQPK